MSAKTAVVFRRGCRVLPEFECVPQFRFYATLRKRFNFYDTGFIFLKNFSYIVSGMYHLSHDKDRSYQVRMRIVTSKISRPMINTSVFAR
jgi:hypothetical protein